jgi:type VI secretion system secreted protein VgrG
VVVMADHQRFKELDEPYASLRFLPDGEEHRAIQGREGVQRLQRTRRIRPNNVALRDFDYHVPGKRLDADAQVEQQSLAGLTLEHYDYADAGLYRDVERGERLAQIRLEAMQAQANTLTGVANVRGLTIGRAFSIEGHPDDKRNRRFHLISTKLHFVQDGPDSTSQGRNMGGEFKVLNDDQPFRPRLLTLRPVVPGIQSATVVGPEGSEVHTDKLGRIRVHFHWDRYKTTEEDASCWIRVSQAWAGKGWGVIAMPRVGQEVLITYVDGNIDCPLVTGIVYNGDNPTPYDLPKDIRYSGIVSRSHKFGKNQHASQLTFDDTRGAERVMIHAERDQQVTVERNLSTIVKNDENKTVAATATTVKDLNISYTRTSISYTGQSISFTGLSTGYTGINFGFTGISTTFTGVNTAFTGKSTNFTGVATRFNGISTSFTGVETSFTGVATRFTGVGTNIRGVNVSMTGVSSSKTGVDTKATGKSSSVTGVAFKATGVSTSVTGSEVKSTGSSISKTGSVVKSTGTDISSTGIKVASTQTSVSSTQFKASYTGTSISHTDISKTAKGNEKTVTATSSVKSGQDLVKLAMQIKN